jgi:hypothetical protein
MYQLCIVIFKKKTSAPWIRQLRSPDWSCSHRATLGRLAKALALSIAGAAELFYVLL